MDYAGCVSRHKLAEQCVIKVFKLACVSILTKRRGLIADIRFSRHSFGIASKKNFRRGFLDRPNLFVAATGWQDEGKIDHALHGKMPVLCLSRSPHGYGILTQPDADLGEDALIIGRSLTASKVQRVRHSFESVEELPSIAIMQGGQPAFELSVSFAHTFLDASYWRPTLKR